VQKILDSENDAAPVTGYYSYLHVKPPYADDFNNPEYMHHFYDNIGAYRDYIDGSLNTGLGINIVGVFAKISTVINISYAENTGSYQDSDIHFLTSSQNIFSGAEKTGDAREVYADDPTWRSVHRHSFPLRKNTSYFMKFYMLFH